MSPTPRACACAVGCACPACNVRRGGRGRLDITLPAVLRRWGKLRAQFVLFLAGGTGSPTPHQSHKQLQDSPRTMPGLIRGKPPHNTHSTPTHNTLCKHPQHTNAPRSAAFPGFSSRPSHPRPPNIQTSLTHAHILMPTFKHTPPLPLKPPPTPILLLSTPCTAAPWRPWPPAPASRGSARPSWSWWRRRSGGWSPT